MWPLLLAGCASGQGGDDPQAAPAPVGVRTVAPAQILPHTRLVLYGNNFAPSATHIVHFDGRVETAAASRQMSYEAQVHPSSDMEHAEFVVDEAAFQAFGEGTFKGSLWVVSANPYGATTGEQTEATLTFARHLDPRITDVGDGLVHLNTLVPVHGEGLLLGGEEGQTLVALTGCFLPETGTAPCTTGGKQITVRLPVAAEAEGLRSQGTFTFAPSIAGISPGSFTGTLALVNIHGDKEERTSAPQTVSFELQRTRLYRLDPGSVSLGQYLDIRGAGFVGGDQANTVIHFDGSFTPQGGSSRPVQCDLVGAFQHGGLLRYVLEEGQGMGQLIELRRETGVLAGTWVPTVFVDGASEEGLPLTLSVQVAPVKQVVWVRYSKAWEESLVRFGLLAADMPVRARLLEVMRRDYAGTNAEFREDEPADFKLYAKLDIGGADPNGLGLLGYDNTPGKDVDNQRLYDWVGGVNALTQQDGYPGYGGVFLESLLSFSEHPPQGVLSSPLRNALFDEVFDPFRPDGGTPLSSAESVSAADGSAVTCPTAGDRVALARCAIRVLGNIVGSTASHEFGHSLGLADPYGPAGQYHNPGDVPNRLMETGSGRPFEERAEMKGQGPAVFCDEEFVYLKKILPLDPPADPPITRPICY